MESQDYDTVSGIQAFLARGLAGLNELISARHEAGYKQHERMSEFVIRGRWMADTCGNFGKFTGKAPKDLFPKMADVVTREEFWDAIKTLTGPNTSFSWTFTSDVPPVGIVCYECGMPWTIEDCHDAVVGHRDEIVPLDAYVGKTLEQVQTSFGELRNSIWQLTIEKPIRNDRHIHQVANERGWINATRDYIVEPGDEASFNVWAFRHNSCKARFLERIWRERFTKIFKEAGYTDFRLILVPNLYCGNTSCCPPWFHVEFAIGTGIRFVIVGPRKRVVNIDCTTMGINVAALFPKEDVTKDQYSIHAWTEEKEIEYLRRIREELWLRE